MQDVEERFQKHGTAGSQLAESASRVSQKEAVTLPWMRPRGIFSALSKRSDYSK